MAENTVDTWAPIRDLIIEGESQGSGDGNVYNAINQPYNLKPLTELSKMKLKDVVAWTQANSAAVGAYQFRATTLQETMDSLGMTGDEEFNSENQTKLADKLIEQTYKVSGENPQQFQNNLAGRWIALQKYDGSGHEGKPAKVNTTRIQQAILGIANKVPYTSSQHVGQTTPATSMTVSSEIPEPAKDITPVSKVEYLVRPEGLIASGGKWYMPKDGPQNYSDEGFKKGSAQFNFQGAIDKLSGSENEQDKDMLQKIMKIKDEMGDKAGIDLTRENDSIDWKWKDQSQRDKRWSGVAKEDKNGPFGGKKALGASGAKYEDALNYMIQNNHLTYDKGEMVADLTQEYKDIIKEPVEEKPATAEVPASSGGVPKSKDAIKEVTEETILDKIEVKSPKVNTVKVAKVAKNVDDDAKSDSTKSYGKYAKDVAKNVGKTQLTIPSSHGFLAWEKERASAPSNADVINKALDEAKLKLKFMNNRDIDGKPVKHFLGGLLAAAGKAIIPMAKQALPSLIEKMGGSGELGSVLAGTIKVKPKETEEVSEGTTEGVKAPTDLADMPEESLMKLVERIKGLLGTPVQGIAKSSVVSAKDEINLMSIGGTVLYNAIEAAKKPFTDVKAITGTPIKFKPQSKFLPRRDEILGVGITSFMKPSTPDGLNVNKLKFNQVLPEGSVKEQTGLEKLASGVDLNALTRFAFSKPVRSKPVHLQISPYRPMVIRNPETGVTTEQQRIAEQELADQMQMGTNNNPDDVRTSIAKARLLSEYRGKVETGKAQNKIATEGAFTAAVNQDNAQKSAHEQKVQQIDYANRSADEQADMQYDLLQQKREGQLVADTLSSRGNIANAERTMDYQVARAEYETGMREIKGKAIVATNAYQVALENKNKYPGDASYESAFIVAEKAYKDAIAEYNTKNSELNVKMMDIQRKSAINTAGNGTLGSVGFSFKAGGSLEKARLKAAVYHERTELKNAIDENKLAERRAMNAYKIYRDTTAIVKKSNEALVKAYFKKY